MSSLLEQPELIDCKEPMVDAAQKLPDCDKTSATTLLKKKNKKAAPKKKKKTASPGASQNIGKPKRALTAYNIFFREERRKMLADMSLPNLAFEALGKRVGAMWQNITPQEKAKFEHLAAKDKWRYSMEMGEWTMAQLEEKARSLVQASSSAAAVAVEKTPPASNETTPAASGRASGFDVCSGLVGGSMGPFEGSSSDSCQPFQGSNSCQEAVVPILDYNSSSQVSTFHGNHMNHSSNESGFNRQLLHQQQLQHQFQDPNNGSGGTSFIPLSPSTPQWATSTAHTPMSTPSPQGECPTSHFCMGCLRMQQQQQQRRQQRMHQQMQMQQQMQVQQQIQMHQQQMQQRLKQMQQASFHAAPPVKYINASNHNNDNNNSFRSSSNSHRNHDCFLPDFDPIPLNSKPIQDVVRPRRSRRCDKREEEHIRYQSNNEEVRDDDYSINRFDYLLV